MEKMLRGKASTYVLPITAMLLLHQGAASGPSIRPAYCDGVIGSSLQNYYTKVKVNREHGVQADETQWDLKMKCAIFRISMLFSRCYQDFVEQSKSAGTEYQTTCVEKVDVHHHTNLIISAIQGILAYVGILAVFCLALLALASGFAMFRK